MFVGILQFFLKLSVFCAVLLFFSANCVLVDVGYLDFQSPAWIKLDHLLQSRHDRSSARIYLVRLDMQ